MPADPGLKGTVSVADPQVVDRAALRAFQGEVGSGYARILGYFREDGIKSVAAIEEGMRQRSAAALIIPAHTLKGESLQFGAGPLATLAEHIELTARGCVESQALPDILVPDVWKLRGLFDETMTALAQDGAAPAPPARSVGGRPVFGRRTFGTATR